MPAPTVLPLKEFLSLKKLPSKPPLLFLTKKQSKQFLSQAEEIPIKEWDRIVVKGTPILQITPFPDGNVITPTCASGSTSVACVPEFKITPQGVVVARCRCFTIGTEFDEEAEGKPDVPVEYLPPPACNVYLDPLTGALRCGGVCDPKRNVCRPVFTTSPFGRAVASLSESFNTRKSSPILILQYFLYKIIN